MRRRYATQSEAAAQGFLDKTALRALRLKPATSTPTMVYWQGQVFVTAYERARCIPMRIYRPATPMQLTAMAQGRARAREMRLEAEEQELRERWEDQLREEQAARSRAVACASEWLSRSPLFLDTETTGLEAQDQVIEIAVVEACGAVLLETLVRPTVPVHPEAQGVHKVPPELLAAAPLWPEVLPHLARLLKDRLVVAHHAAFDTQMLAQTCRAHGLQDLPGTIRWECTMDLLVEVNWGRWPSLDRALRIAGAGGGVGHRAASDAQACRRVVVALAAEAEAVAAMPAQGASPQLVQCTGGAMDHQANRAGKPSVQPVELGGDAAAGWEGWG